MTTPCAWADCQHEATGLFCAEHQLEADAWDQELINERAWQRVAAMQDKPHVRPMLPENLYEIGRVVALVERAGMTEQEFRELVTGEKPPAEPSRFEQAARMALIYACLFLAGCYAVVALRMLGVLP